MPRTYRHNLEKARQLEPELCDNCDELAGKHLVHTYPTWTSLMTYRLCDDCLPILVGRLKAQGKEYRVGGFA